MIDGGGLENWPATHMTFHAVQEVEAGAVLNVPAAHSTQLVWVVAVPGPTVSVPAGQMICGVQVELFSVDENVPAAHGAHTRSVNASPSVVTDVPTTQVVLLMQGVAAFASSSHVPWAHTVGKEVPPMQEVPLTQIAQAAGVDWVAGAVWYVPGKQAPGGPHCDTFGPFVFRPGAHASQIRSNFEVGVLRMCVPG